MARARRRILAWLPLTPWLVGRAGAAGDTDGGLPRPTNLQAEGTAMRAAHQPMLVLFSQRGCHWCEQARAQYLRPMSIEAEWRDQARFRQIDLDADTPLRDFAGKPTTHRALARALGVRFAPTVMLLGPDGAVLGEPIVGMRLPDFYGAYVGQAISDARRRLGAG